MLDTAVEPACRRLLDRERSPSYEPSAQIKRGAEGETEDGPKEKRRRMGGGPWHLHVTREKALKRRIHVCQMRRGIHACLRHEFRARSSPLSVASLRV